MAGCSEGEVDHLCCLWAWWVWGVGKGRRNDLLGDAWEDVDGGGGSWRKAKEVSEGVLRLLECFPERRRG